MLLEGKYGQAKVFASIIDDITLSQIRTMLDQEFTAGERIAIMPDSHAGKGSVVGTTMTIDNGKVVPNVVGVDIGCGILVYKLKEKEIDFVLLDGIINAYIPSRFNVHDRPTTQVAAYVKDLLSGLSFKTQVDYMARSLGSLGGGNHFIEVAQGSDGSLYLLVHSGSRNLGVQVADHHQNIAIKNLNTPSDADKHKLIDSLKADNRQGEIEKELKKLNEISRKYPDDLCYLEDECLEDYLNDMKIAQEFATNNRKLMLDTIVDLMGFTVVDSFDSMHNYIDLEDGILRKGATDASLGRKLIIPINMRDGSIIAKGKGNEAWNNSAPHGAGRILSRTQAKKILDLEEVKSEMEGIYTTSLSKHTLDEAPGAYKPIDIILEDIKDTVEIVDIIKPLYNFKA